MRTHGAVVGRRFRSVTKLTTKVRIGRGYLWGSFLIAAAALKTPTKNGYNAQGVNLKLHMQSLPYPTPFPNATASLLLTGAQSGPLGVPGNSSAPTASVYIAPQGLFSHFPYGNFFPAMRHCRSSSWDWAKYSPLERRMCAPPPPPPPLKHETTPSGIPRWYPSSLFLSQDQLLPG